MIAFLNREVASFHAAALILGAAAFAAKLLGLARDRLLAHTFGAGEVLDTYYAAFQLPDILFAAFLLGAASAAVLPIFLDAEQRGPAAAERFVSNLLTTFALGAVLATALAVVLAPRIVPLLAPGFSGRELKEAIALARIMLAGPFLLGVAGILSSVLQARHRFFIFALPPIVYNLGIIAGIVAFVPWAGPIGLAYGVALGAALQVLVQLPAFGAMGFRLRPVLDLADPALGRVIRVSFPRVCAIAMSHLTLAALTAVASLFAVGSISVFRLAVNLIFVPVGLFGLPWALAIFPKLSSAWLAGRGQAFGDHVALGLRSIFFWTVPSVALAVVLRAHIVRVALGSGVFNWEDTRLVAAVLAVIAVVAVSESVVPLILRAFYALGRTAAPFLWDVTASLATVGLAVSAARLFADRPEALNWVSRVLRIGDLPSPEVLAVAIAFAAGSVLNAVLLALALRRAARRALGVTLSFELDSLAAVSGASVLGAAAAYGVLLPFPALVATNTFAGIAAQGFTAGAVGLAVYGALLAWQRHPEILALIHSVRYRLLSPAKVPVVFEAEKLDGERTG